MRRGVIIIGDFDESSTTCSSFEEDYKLIVDNRFFCGRDYENYFSQFSILYPETERLEVQNQFTEPITVNFDVFKVQVLEIYGKGGITFTGQANNHVPYLIVTYCQDLSIQNFNGHTLDCIECRFNPNCDFSTSFQYFLLNPGSFSSYSTNNFISSAQYIGPDLRGPSELQITLRDGSWDIKDYGVISYQDESQGLVVLGNFNSITIEQGTGISNYNGLLNITVFKHSSFVFSSSVELPDAVLTYDKNNYNADFSGLYDIREEQLYEFNRDSSEPGVPDQPGWRPDDEDDKDDKEGNPQIGDPEDFNLKMIMSIIIAVIVLIYVIAIAISVTCIFCRMRIRKTVVKESRIEASNSSTYSQDSYSDNSQSDSDNSNKPSSVPGNIKQDDIVL